MYTNEVDETIQRFIKMFYQVGMWQRDDESMLRKVAKKLFHTIFGASYPIFLLTNSFLCDDRSESIYSIQLTIIGLFLYVKYLYVLFKKREILALLYDKNVIHATENREEYEQNKRKIGKFMKFVRPFVLSIFITCPLLVVVKLPIFSDDKTLPMFISFTWNNSEIIYWVAFCYLALALLLYAIAIQITILIWYIMFNYSIEYEMLGNRLRNLGTETKTKMIRDVQKRIMLVPRNFNENFIVSVKACRTLTKTIQRFESCLSTLFLFQYFTSGIGICGSIYNLAFASKENIVQMEWDGIILFYGLSDIFLIMYLANEITDASDRLRYCLFQCNWIEQTEPCKKCVLIMGEMLKQPQQLVIVIYPMNLQTFMTIVNGAYKMFNVLKNFQ
uniref:Odorant receptor n=1 Tax=Bradysia odoriphaga TaxID=1564500 RepID=A0A6B9C9S1_9DIPT|nr:odorant receptor 46 [Bradysia odoriphaga]